MVVGWADGADILFGGYFRVWYLQGFLEFLGNFRCVYILEGRSRCSGYNRWREACGRTSVDRERLMPRDF